MNLERIAVAVLALALGGCCSADDEQTVTTEHDGIAAADRLESARSDNATAETRCEAACIAIVEEDEGEIVDAVTECSATAETVPDDPWDPANTRVFITCSTEQTMGTFCTGRRPLGHREAALAVTGRGSWFAVHAHLEAASVTAFEELALWLEEQHAPPTLPARCRDAAADEVRHAEVTAAWAEREGHAVPAIEADPMPRGLLALAIHNAVEGCVREAFAAIVARVQAVRAESPALREMFDTIAADELRHGVLAWDLHAWLMQRLNARERAEVERAQADAIASLAALAADNARCTPAGLGWPAPEVAAQMARHFGHQLSLAA